ncbi:MAG: hypothetical protein PHN42_00365 [Bacilli bacterium]|nr:hypothetical protein [Bacilli bacterium]
MEMDYFIRSAANIILPHIDDNTSLPLLMPSDDEFLEKRRNSYQLMYIGQENPGWLNWMEEFDLEKIQQKYIDQLKHFMNLGSKTTTPFWGFLREIKNDLNEDNLIWTNCLLLGSKYGNKRAHNYKDIEKISLLNLIYLYKYFKPDCVVIVAGPENPYYTIIQYFLEEIDSSLRGKCPDKRNLLVSDLNMNIHYTYHPQALARGNVFGEVAEKVKTYVK